MDHEQGMEFLKSLQGDYVTPQPDRLAIPDATKTSSLDRERAASWAAEQARLDQLQKQRQDALDTARLLRAAEIPALHLARTDLHGERWTATRDSIEGRLGDGFLIALLGPRGTGKTQLAACLVASSCQALRPARYVKAQGLFRAIRATFKDDSDETDEQVIKRFTAYSLLVIDESHEQGRTAFETRTLTDVVDDRYHARRDTLLISNETIEAFSAAVGPSIISRLNETGEIIECDWPSYRP